MAYNSMYYKSLGNNRYHYPYTLISLFPTSLEVTVLLSYTRQGLKFSISPVIARSEATKQSPDFQPVMRLLRFARNDSIL